MITKPPTPRHDEFARGACDAILSRRLYIELTVIETGALEPRWNAVEAARARGVSVCARAGDDRIDTVGSALLEFPGEAGGD
jgi:hypothetical protein